MIQAFARCNESALVRGLGAAPPDLHPPGQVERVARENE